MRVLIPGLKAWPYHHEVEHLLAQALQAAGHSVAFLGCSREGMSACECVDRAVHEGQGGHSAFCAGCHTRQGGVHERAGFLEIPAPGDPGLERRLEERLAGQDAQGLLALPVAGSTLSDIAGPSLMRWARSGRPMATTIPLAVLAAHARQALRLEALLPGLLEREGIELVILLNGLFLSERVVSEVARARGIRVVNYERGHARNTLVLSHDQPACFLEIGPEPPDFPQWDEDPLLAAYLAGRAHNRDASTRFGTGGAATDGGSRASRPQVLVLTNVCWDSAVSARGSGFGTYLAWLEAVIELARARPELDFTLRVHPGEARLHYDPTLDRTESWLGERELPANLAVVGADDPRSTYGLMETASAGVVYVTSAGLEMACAGKPVIICGEVHYAGRGFTIDCPGPRELSDCLDRALREGVQEARAVAARRYAGRLFLDTPTPFPWVDEVEYGRPQRVAPPITAQWLARDPLLRRLVDALVGAAERPHSLRELLADAALCPLPFHFGSRPAARTARIAVLIPAHERPEILRRAMQAWAGQDYPHEHFSLLVVDDGSQPPLETPVRQALAEIRAAGGRLEVELLRLDLSGGPARARNAGLRWLLDQPESSDRILITGDDMLPEQDALSRLAAEHAAWDDGHVAILGRVDWDTERGVSRVMRLVDQSGLQFGFRGLPARAWLPAQYFYTSSVSLPTAFLRETGLRFAEDFPHAAWEDVEFGARAMEQGLVLVYDAAIRFRHDHPTDYAAFARRQRKAGACARIFRAGRPRDFAAICGAEPQDPPDRIMIRQLEEALGELSKLELARLRVLPGPAGGDLAGHLDREQDRLLATLFRLHSDAGWFATPPLPQGAGRPGLLSILVPVFNQAELTRACLEALHAHTSRPFEVIVADNGSTDGTPALLKEWPTVRTMRLERNLGFARATNLAAARASGALLVLLNNDTVVTPGWDLALRDELARPSTGAAGLRLLYPDGTIQHAGLVFGADGLPWHVYRGFPAEAPEVMRRRTFNALTGACLGLRREVWREAGGLDENFINCYEDIDLCLRLRERGYELVYRPDGVVVHHEGRSEGRGDRVTHSWLALQERWAGRLPCDEGDLLAEDGWEALREPGSLRLRRRVDSGRPKAEPSAHARRPMSRRKEEPGVEAAS